MGFCPNMYLISIFIFFQFQQFGKNLRALTVVRILPDLRDLQSNVPQGIIARDVLRRGHRGLNLSHCCIKLSGTTKTCRCSQSACCLDHHVQEPRPCNRLMYVIERTCLLVNSIPRACRTLVHFVKPNIDLQQYATVQKHEELRCPWKSGFHCLIFFRIFIYMIYIIFKLRSLPIGHTGAKTNFLFRNYQEFDGWKMWILWKMIFWKCEFCEKWDFESVNFVKNEILKVWILSKVRLWNWEFLEKLRIFAPVCFIEWQNRGVYVRFLSHWK